MDISGIVEDGVIVPSNSSTVPISYDQCCLRNDPTVSTYGASSRSKKPEMSEWIRPSIYY